MAAKLQRNSFFFVLLILLLATFLASSARAHGDEDHDADHADADHAEEPVDLKARGLILTKVYCLIVIFFATFIPGVSPYFLRWNNAFLVLGIQFAGGVFFATAMLHFLADSDSTFGDLTTKTYPFAFMLAVSGYLMTMLADVIIQFVFARQPVADRKPVDVENNATAGKVREGDTKSCCGQRASSCKCAAELAESQEVTDVVKATLIHKASLGDAVLLIFALCFHSVFEGIAIGVAGTKYDAWRNLWTITLHKVFAAIAMGIALLRMAPNRPLLSCAAYAFAFAISSPVGVGIGIAIDSTTQGSTADWIYAIAMGIATGIFIYVAINHLLAKAHVPLYKARFDRPIFKYLAVTLGCGLIFVVMIWDA